MTTMYCLASKDEREVYGYSGVKKLNDLYLVPFGDYENSVSFPVDEKGHKRLGGKAKMIAKSGQGFLFTIDYDEFWKLEDA